MQKTKPTAHKYGSARSLPKRQSARRGVSCSAARKEPPQPAGPGLPPLPSRARGADSSVACSAGSCSSSLDLAGGKVSAAVSKPSSLNRAWLNHMVPKLVNTVNKSTHLSPPARRGEGAVTMAFVCNETFEEPLTRVLQETTQPAEEGGSFEDWNVIMEGVSAMDRMDTMAGVLVVKPLFDESALKCPSGRDRAATLLTQNALRGSVGDCCEDDFEDDDDDVVFESNVYSEPRSFQDIYAAADEASGDMPALERSYGVVLQSVERNPVVDGCYILRTSTSRSVGCTCTHYSMSRALCGADGNCMTVQEQVDKSWLVNPFTV